MKKNITTARMSFVAILLFAALIIGTGVERFGSTAQNLEKLFIPVDSNKADLTPRQEDLLAQIKSLKTSGQVRLVRIKTDLLTPNSPSVRVNVGKDFNAFTTESRMREGGLTWVGSATPAVSSESAVLVVKDGNVTGTVRTGSELYSVMPLGGGLHALVRQDESKFPPEHPPNFEQKEKTAPKDRPATNTADVPDAPKTLRILVAYTQKVATARPDIHPFIDVAMIETNLGYTNSHVSVRAELAHAYQVSYQESGDHDADLEKFRNKNDAVMDEVHELRNIYKADVCVLLIDDDSYCGTASTIMADESTAFGIVHYSCAIGYYSFAHEIGHLQGARHNKEADPENSPFSYGHGYYYETKKWRTIMSYNCPVGCSRLPYWANPNVLYDGVPMGNEHDSNDSRVLNETAPIVTAFRN